MPEQDLGKIERLKQRLYSRAHPIEDPVREHELKQGKSAVQTDWGTTIPSVAEREVTITPQEMKRIPFAKFFFFGALITLVLAGAYAAFLFFGGANALSSRNVDLAVSGPVSVPGGEPFQFTIAIANNNNESLEVGDIVIEYPAGTRSATDQTVELPRVREGVGDIKPNESVTRQFSAILFGEERSTQEVAVAFEYRLPNSNAVFYKKTVYSVVLSSSPLSVRVDGPIEAISGQDVSFAVTVTSNATAPVKNTILAASYPAGWSFTGSDPAPMTGRNSVWSLGDLAPGSSKTVTVRGKLLGENADARAFRFESGSSKATDPTALAAPLGALSQVVTLKKPFLGLAATVNNKNDAEISIGGGDVVQVALTYTNNLSVPITDAVISMALAGDALSQSSVVPNSGFYRSDDNTVIWDSTIFADLKLIEPGRSGQVSFSFRARDVSGLSVANPSITLKGSVSGTRREGAGVPEKVENIVQRTVKFGANVFLSGRVLHGTGSISNRGPIPPRVGQETTYTIVWSVGNAGSDTADGVVTAVLPSYVRFIGNVDPSSERLTYDDRSKTVTWRVGDSSAGTGYSKSPREVAFQVSIIPSLSQVDSEPILSREAMYTTIDRFTNAKLSAQTGTLTTQTKTDSTYQVGDGVVGK